MCIVYNIGYNLSLISHTVSVDVKHHERRIGYNRAKELCDVTVEVAFMGSPSLIIRTVSVDVKQQLKKKKKKMLQYNYNIAQRVTKLLWGEGSRHGVFVVVVFVCLFVRCCFWTLAVLFFTLLSLSFGFLRAKRL